jgi:hypothetical protein
MKNYALALHIPSLFFFSIIPKAADEKKKK